MKSMLFFLAIAISLSCLAQDETIKKLKSDSETGIKKEEDTTNQKWRIGGFAGLNITQGSLSNWAAGGDEFSLSLNLLSNFYAFMKQGRHTWDNNVDFLLGYVRTTTLGTRKNDDRFDVLSKYGYGLTEKLSAAALFNFRTQFFDGYTYGPNNSKVFASTLLSPAYVLLSVGLDYKPVKDLSIFISPITARWLIVKDDTLSAKGAYGVTPGETSRTEFGAFLNVTYVKEITKSLAYKGRLELFSNYKQNPENVDLFMTNLFALKISKIFSATWSLDFIYDDDVKMFGPNGTSPALQMKSLIGIGVLVKY